MNPAVELHAAEDVTDVPWIVRGAVKLGLMESAFVLLFSLASRFLPAGPIETIVLAIILFAGLAAVAFLPGLWTRARTIEGIAGAAGIGLAATVVFLLIDVTDSAEHWDLYESVAGYRRWEQLVVPSSVVDGRHIHPVDGRLAAGESDSAHR